MLSWVEILKTLENVVEVGLARGAHGIVEADGLGWEVDCDENPMHVVDIDWEEQVAQCEDVYFLGPLAHSFEVIGVGRGLVGEHGCSDSKQPRVKLRSETIAAFAIEHEGSAVVQVTVNQQGSAGMNAHIVQPLSWPKAAEAAHRHRRGQVTGDPVLVWVGRGWGAVGQGGCDSLLSCRAQHSQRRVWGRGLVGGGWLRVGTLGPPLSQGGLREAWVAGKQRVGPMHRGPHQQLELDDSSMASSASAPRWSASTKPAGFSSGAGSPAVKRGRASEASAMAREARSASGRGGGEGGGEGIGVGAPEFSELVSFCRAVAKLDMLSSKA